MLRLVNDLLGDAGFWTALAIGLALAASAWLLVRHDRVVLGPAVVALVAALLGLRAGGRLPVALVVGVALLLLGEVFGREMGSWSARFALLVPGALVLGASLPDGIPFDLRTATAVVTILAAPLVVVTAARDPRLAAVLFAISGVGLYVCVPDTEQAKALMGALLAAAALAADPELPVTPGAAALTGLFVWTAAIGGHGRSGSVVGGLACLGVLVLVPLAGWGRTTRRGSWVLGAGQLAYVVFVARVAGFRSTVGAAAVLAIPAAVLLGVVVAVTARRARSRP
jgi:hypothetical protein